MLGSVGLKNGVGHGVDIGCRDGVGRIAPEVDNRNASGLCLVNMIPDLEIPVCLNVGGVIEGVAGKDQAIRLVKK